ncbi:hypothetical protein [Pseudomonas donghuensis]|uniref:Uncharacterized protein n=1 Tax=Pseudomonas donghuensis TaxID=1163398 RepID=A0AAQ0DN23_9PSED|nr:hypothetical protein [Pseudomonas donghuensis]MDF9893524.1 hypothetical protein [Pseudomonas vranovensis]MBF4209783.1 hypothetical protein [Pseudomonas donghuensis]MCP6694621.1 hypothetical protein [Pseudomonas donghuensis]QWE81303.1 hypothetical protein BV82_13680 [Pseudomonas donghuensis]UVL26869.1 hypothetical protein LOY30_13115 [Pseudomonas donghuensis]
MDSIIKLRIGLIIGALFGLLPITVLFSVTLVAIFIHPPFVPEVPSRTIPFTLIASAISMFGIWSGWKIFSIAISSTPALKNKPLLVVGVIVTTLWGLTIAASFKAFIPQIYCFFLTPGITSTVMLVIACKRAALTANEIPGR